MSRWLSWLKKSVPALLIVPAIVAMGYVMITGPRAGALDAVESQVAGSVEKLLQQVGQGATIDVLVSQLRPSKSDIRPSVQAAQLRRLATLGPLLGVQQKSAVFKSRSRNSPALVNRYFQLFDVTYRNHDVSVEAMYALHSGQFVLSSLTVRDVRERK